MTPESAKGLRELLITKVEELDPLRKAALALSGGTDSTTILFAMLESGRKPRCYTFWCEGTVSSDVQAARALTQHFGLELVEVVIPWDVHQVVKDLRAIIPECHVVKKTIVQCLHPWLYIYPAMWERGDQLVLDGLGGDDHYCMQRKVNVLLNTQGEQAVLEKGWRKCFGDDPLFTPWNIHRFAQRWAIEAHCVYFDQRIEDWFCKHPIRELHTMPDGSRFEKAASVLAFEDWYKKGRFYRKHHSYQKNSRLQDLHNALITSEYNMRGAKDVIAIYNDIRDGLL